MEAIEAPQAIEARRARVRSLPSEPYRTSKAIKLKRCRGAGSPFGMWSS
jgi:hypothetical protein